MDIFDSVSPIMMKKVHIRVQQRNGRKNITIIQGLDDDLDLKKIMKAMKHKFACNGAILKDRNGEDVIQLQGDMRENAEKWLYYHEIYSPKDDRIVVHGS